MIAVVDGVARSTIEQFHVQCTQCADAIEVSVLVYMPEAAITRHKLNELLVDLGWLPTLNGGLCRHHALLVRRR